MSGMLNGGGGFDPNQLMMMLNQSRQDPFTRPLPGQALLGEGGMAMPQQTPGVGMPDQEQMQPEQGMAPLPPVGLPNFPATFEGFGMGRFAPQENQGDPIRQQLIKQLLQMLPQMGGGGSMSGMGGF